MRVVPVCLLSVTFFLSCIERPEHMAGESSLNRMAPRLNRSALSDVLLTTLPPVAHPVGAVFDNAIELLGYNVTPEPATRGDRATVTVFYRALQDISDDWQVFVHCEDQAKVQQRFNMDHFPANGRMRTNTWRRGDIIRDEWTFPFPAAESGIEFWTGFFRDEDRLTVTSAGRGVNDGTNRIRMGVLTAQ